MSADVLEHLTHSRYGLLSYDPWTADGAVERILVSLQKFNLKLNVSSSSAASIWNDQEYFDDEETGNVVWESSELVEKGSSAFGSFAGSRVDSCDSKPEKMGTKSLSSFLADLETEADVSPVETALLQTHSDWMQRVERRVQTRISDVDAKLAEIEASSPKSLPSPSILPSPPDFSMAQVEEDLEQLKRLRNRDRAAKLADLQVRLDAVASLPHDYIGYGHPCSGSAEPFSQPSSSVPSLARLPGTPPSVPPPTTTTRRLKRPSSTDREIAGPGGSGVSVSSGSSGPLGGAGGSSERVIAHPGGNSRSSSSEPPPSGYAPLGGGQRRYSAQSGSRKTPSPGLGAAASGSPAGATTIGGGSLSIAVAPVQILGKRNSFSSDPLILSGEMATDKDHLLPAIDEKLTGSNSPGSNAAATIATDFKFVLPQKSNPQNKLETSPDDSHSVGLPGLNCETENFKFIEGLVQDLVSVYPLDNSVDKLVALPQLKQMLHGCLDLITQLTMPDNKVHGFGDDDQGHEVAVNFRSQALATFTGFFTGAIAPDMALHGLGSLVLALRQYLENMESIRQIRSTSAVTTDPVVPRETPLGGSKTVATREQKATGPIASDASDHKAGHSNEMIQLFDKMLTAYDSYQSALEPFTKSADSKVKFMRMELKKSINTIINTLCSTHLDDLEDKLVRLKAILGGRERCGPPHRQVSVEDHPLARDYCLDLFATQIVSQADIVVSSHLESAFPLAWVTLGLISDYPKLRNIVLSCLYKSCPFLFPFFLPFGQLAEFEAKKLMGYRVDKEGTMEETGMFLNRLSGYTGLFGALLVSPVPVPGQQRFRASNSPFRLDRTRRANDPGAPRKPNPFGVGMAWSLVHNLVNLRPTRDITPTVIHGILMITGFAMHDVYKSSFRKLVELLTTLYLPEIEKVSMGGGEASLMRLDNLIQERTYLKLPPGYIQ